MDFINDIIGITALILTSAVIILCLTQIFFPKRKKRITVVKKYISQHKGLNQTRSRATLSENYIIKCRYPDSENADKIHTFNCMDKSLYESLKTGKSYTVTIKMFEVVQLDKK